MPSLSESLAQAIAFDRAGRLPEAKRIYRHNALSYLSTIGQPETIAASCEDYVEIAVGLAGDLAGLAGIRAGLRQQMAASPLCDGKRFAEELMEVLRGVV